MNGYEHKQRDFYGFNDDRTGRHNDVLSILFSVQYKSCGGFCKGLLQVFDWIKCNVLVFSAVDGKVESALIALRPLRSLTYCDGLCYKA